MKTINNFIKCTAATILATTLLCGCGQLASNSDYDGYLWNGGNRTKHLAAHTPELDEIPRDYLEYIGFDPDDYEIETLNQWSNNNFGAQAAYHSHVYKEGEGADSGFYIWVVDDGRVMDTRFVEKLEPAVEKYLAKEIQEDYPDVEVMASIFFRNMPSKEWSKSDGIENLLNSDDEYRIYLYIVYSDDVHMTKSDVDAIEEKLSYLNDVEARFYRVEDPDDIDMEDLYSMDAEFKFY